jgi:hypothetical protein
MITVLIMNVVSDRVEAVSNPSHIALQEKNWFEFNLDVSNVAVELVKHVTDVLWARAPDMHTKARLHVSTQLCVSTRLHTWCTASDISGADTYIQTYKHTYIHIHTYIPAEIFFKHVLRGDTRCCNGSS